MVFFREGREKWWLLEINFILMVDHSYIRYSLLGDLVGTSNFLAVHNHFKIKKWKKNHQIQRHICMSWATILLLLEVHSFVCICSSLAGRYSRGRQHPSVCLLCRIFPSTSRTHCHSLSQWGVPRPAYIKRAQLSCFASLFFRHHLQLTLSSVPFVSRPSLPKEVAVVLCTLVAQSWVWHRGHTQ